MSRDHVLAFDLGGTKISSAIVDREGKILTQLKEPVRTQEGFQGLISQFERMGKRLLKERPSIEFGGIASAGPLDPVSGVLLDPTNLLTNGQPWGVVPLLKEVEKALGLRMKLENDAAAAILAEHWVGGAAKVKNAVSLTLGTGLGVGVLANGRLVRSGRNLHPEAGHMVIEMGSAEALCGCGNYGCAEAYLSGVNFTKLLTKRWGLNEKLTGEKLVQMAKDKDERALMAFKEYAQRLAYFINNLIVLFGPEKILFSGGFSESHELFIDEANKSLEGLLSRRRDGVDLMPRLEPSEFRDEAGLLGAAHVAFQTLID